MHWAAREIPEAYKYFFVFQNWWLTLADWAGIVQKGKMVILQFRNGNKCKIRAGSSDRNAVINMVIHNEYRINKTTKYKKYKNIVDIGGHIGCFPIFISRICPDARVFSFEPEPQNYRLLLENIKLNGLEKMVTSSNSAISDREGSIRLYMHGETFAHSTSIASTDFINVPCHSLEQVFLRNKIDRCDLLKINAEGAEYPVLLNTTKETLSRIRDIRAHCHTIDSDRNVDILVAFLSANGFNCVKHGELLSAEKNW